MTSFEIEVQEDHLQKLTQVRKPLLAIAELIWNSVDADADRVDVEIRLNPLGSIDAVEVKDNGHGIPRNEVQELFASSVDRGSKTSSDLKRNAEFCTARKVAEDSKRLQSENASTGLCATAQRTSGTDIPFTWTNRA